ncbi:hypothetical protein ACN28S_14815 [Cystobacter fuscus]
MKTKRSLLLAVLAGIAIGALPAMSLYAQAEAKTMKIRLTVGEKVLTATTFKVMWRVLP